MANSAEQRHERLLWGKTTEFLDRGISPMESSQFSAEEKERLLSLLDSTPNTISDMLDAVRAEHANGDDTEHDRDCGD